MLKRKGKLNTIYLSDALQKQLQGICEYPLTSVVAPMAYGKTTAINWFLDKRAKPPARKSCASVSTPMPCPFSGRASRSPLPTPGWTF